MIRVRWHIPGYVDVDPPAEASFASTAQMLEHEFPQRFNHNYVVSGATAAGPVLGPGSYFTGFAISDDLLMAIQNNGARWWVVGRVLEGLDEIDLPRVTYESQGYMNKPRTSEVSVARLVPRG